MAEYYYAYGDTYPQNDDRTYLQGKMIWKCNEILGIF